jgi:hypothetical protein
MVFDKMFGSSQRATVKTDWLVQDSEKIKALIRLTFTMIRRVRRTFEKFDMISVKGK